MSASNIARQLQLQLAVSQAAEEKGRKVRYGRKHKTENLQSQITRCEDDRRNSVCLESTRRKKTEVRAEVGAGRCTHQLPTCAST